MHVIGAEVLLQVHHELGSHDGILQVTLNPLQTLDTFITSIFSSITNSHGLANMNSSVHEEVVDHAVEHPNVPPGDVVVASVAIIRESGAVVSGEVLHDVLGGILDHVAQLMHLVGALVAGEPWVRSSKGVGNTKEKDSQGSLHDDLCFNELFRNSPSLCISSVHS